MNIKTLKFNCTSKVRFAGGVLLRKGVLPMIEITFFLAAIANVLSFVLELTIWIKSSKKIGKGKKKKSQR